MASPLDDLLKCPYYHNGHGMETWRDPACMLNVTKSPKCEAGDITTCIYKTDQGVIWIVKQLKDKAMREEERFRKILLKLTNAFDGPYR